MDMLLMTTMNKTQKI